MRCYPNHGGAQDHLHAGSRVHAYRAGCARRNADDLRQRHHQPTAFDAFRRRDSRSGSIEEQPGIRKREVRPQACPVLQRDQSSDTDSDSKREFQWSECRRFLSDGRHLHYDPRRWKGMHDSCDVQARSAGNRIGDAVDFRQYRSTESLHGGAQHRTYHSGNCSSNFYCFRDA